MDHGGVFEERVVIVRAGSESKAFAKAQKDAKKLARILNSRHLGLLQLFKIEGKPEDGTEVFSLMRDSPLSPDEYIDRYFETGSEHQRT